MINTYKKLILILLSILINIPPLWAQREYKIHNRGMLHESVFNNGILGQPLHAKGIEESAQPMMEWPCRSATVVQGIRYDGQHCSLGGGLYIMGNLPGKLGLDNKMFAFCGLVGITTPEESVGRWTFPIQFYETKNYPVLDDGTLNPDYNPNEGEQIITAKWATSVGVTVTRVTRQWSYPDIDDLIIHEYEFVFTGDTDGIEETIEMDTVNTLVDVTINFGLNIAPSMYGYQRHYNQWKWKPGIFQGDDWASFDPDYWLLFNMDCETNNDPGLAGKPEPIPELFKEFSETGKNGGGLASPQAMGFTVLYVDTDHLTVMSPTDSTVSEYWQNAQNNPEQLDENFKIKQPWSIWKNQGLYASEQLMGGGRAATLTDTRGDGYWGQADIDAGIIGAEWLGRAKFDLAKVDVPGRNFIIGPYTLNKGDKIELSLAQVAGYGADDKPVMGGGQNQVYWAVPPTRNALIVLNGEVMTEHYIDDYGYPDYVNSDVITVQDVARKAWELYTGREIPHDSTWAEGELVCWPENNPRDGVYQFPIPPAAPAITVTNTDRATIRIRWNRNVENFKYATEPGQAFNIYRAFHPMGPWKRVGTKTVGDVNADGVYQFENTDPEFKVGDFAFYAVTFQSPNGLESGKTNFTRIQKNIGAVDKVTKVYVVPNPFVVKSGFSGAGNENMIGFYGLPAKCTIDILSYSGQRIETIKHDSPTFSHEFFQVTRNNQVMASGIYFFVVRTPDGQETGGKFAIIK